MQKTFRDMQREGERGGVQFRVGLTGGFPDPSTIPGMVEALAEFTRKNGTERTSWTDDDLDKRIEAIEKRFPETNLNFAASNVVIYRHSSEILHGTYFGVLYFWGSGGVRASSRQTAEYLFLANHFVAVFGAVFLRCMA